MTSQQHQFLDLAVVKQKKYAEIAQTMGVPNNQLSAWWEELKATREVVSGIRKIWKRKGLEGKIDYWEFHNWYTTTERKCCYCGITEEELNELIDSEKVFSKRLVTRGRSMEIERKKPELPYDQMENLTYCCYWCNNAKTDTFTNEEFQKIGKVIGEIWKERMS